ncbi:dystroglycan-related [Anaeramoeba flamelloides]|uniref:Dystroglycan-related n=1 Tax=Anaeramoeba flamelloides TaxID=1746091 RepID=A0AAV8A2Z1_9EUKA|nr:dystroglycan-related [Anaeramoeba flamelloides]
MRNIESDDDWVCNEMLLRFFQMIDLSNAKTQNEDFIKNGFVSATLVIPTDLADQTATAGKDYEYSIDKGSFECDSTEGITYDVNFETLESFPEWLSWEMNTELSDVYFSGASEGCAFTDKIIITATCDDAIDQAEFNFELINTGISIDEANPLEDRIFSVNEYFSFTLNDLHFVNGEPNEEVTYSAKLYNETTGEPEDLPDWVTFIEDQKKFTGITPLGCPQNFTLIATAADTCGNVSSTFIISTRNEKPDINLDFPDYFKQVNTTFILPISDVFDNSQERFEDLTFEILQADLSPLPDWMIYLDFRRALAGKTPLSCNHTYELFVGASDSCYHVGTTFNFTVTNEEPFVHLEIPDQTQYMEQEFTFDLGETYFVQPDVNEELYYEAALIDGSELPEWLVFDDQAHTFSGTPPLSCDETYDIQVTVSDTCYSNIHDNFTLEVVNLPPEFVNLPLPNLEFNVFEDFEFQIGGEYSSNEPVVESLTFGSTLPNDEPLPEWIAFDNVTNTFSGNVKESCGETLQFKYIAYDTCSSAAETFNFTILNAPAKFTDTIANQTLSPGDTVAISFDSIIDNEIGENVTFDSYLLPGHESLPEWLILNQDNSKKYGGTVGGGCPQTFEIELTASDPCQESPAVTFYILEITNTKPYANRDIESFSVNAGEYFEFTIAEDTFINEEVNEELYYEATLIDGSELPEWLSFDNMTATFSGNPSGCDEDFNIKINIFDTCMSEEDDISQNFTITVIAIEPTVDKEILDIEYPINVAFVNEISRQTFTNKFNESYFTYDATLSDGSELPNWIQFDPIEFKFEGTTPFLCGDQIEITVWANDSCSGGSTSDTFVLSWINELPAINTTITEQFITASNEFTIELPQDIFSNELNEELTYHSSLPNGDTLPDWITFDNETLQYSGTAPQGCSQSIDVMIQVSDSCHKKLVNQTFMITTVNDPPTVNGTLEDHSIYIHEDFEWALPVDAFVDDELADNILSYNVLLSNGDELPEWLFFNQRTNELSGNSPDQCGYDLDLMVLAYDSCMEENSANSTFILSVMNDPPLVNLQIPDQETAVGSYFDFTIDDETFLAPEENETLIYSLLGQPEWMDFDQENAHMNGTVALGCAETIELTVIAFDTCTNNKANTSFILAITNAIPVPSQVIQTQTYQLLEEINIAFDKDSLFMNLENEAETLQFSSTLQNGDALPEFLTFDEAEQVTYTGKLESGCTADYPLSITVQDSCEDNTNSNNFILRIENNPPELAKEIETQQADVLQEFSFTIDDSTFYNREMDETLTYEYTLTDANNIIQELNFDSENLIFSGVSSYTCNDYVTLTLKATDSCETNFVETSFNLELSNLPFEAIGEIADQTFYVGQEIIINLDDSPVFNDPESTTQQEHLVYSATLENDEELPKWLSFDPETRQFNGTAPLQCSFEETIKLSVYDDCYPDDILTKTFTISINNVPPTKVQDLEEQTISAGEEFSFTFESSIFTNPEISEELTFTVYETDSVTEAITELMDGFIFSPENNTISNKLVSGCAQEKVFFIKATDSCDTNSEVSELILNIQNETPELAEEIDDQEADTDSDWSYTIPETTFTNAEALETLTYEVTLKDGSKLPDWLSFDEATRELKGTTPDESESYTIKISVTDSCETNQISTTFVLDVESGTVITTALIITAAILGAAGFIGLMVILARKNTKEPEIYTDKEIEQFKDDDDTDESEETTTETNDRDETDSSTDIEDNTSSNKSSNFSSDDSNNNNDSDDDDDDDIDQDPNSNSNSDDSFTSDHSDNSDNSNKSDNSEKSDNSNNSDNFDNSNNSNNSDNSDNPNNSDNSDNSDNPDNSDNSDNSVKSDSTDVNFSSDN